MVAGGAKSFDSVKDELTKAYQKAQAENAFYEASEKLTQLSYEHPDNLQSVSEGLGLKIQKTALFSKANGQGIAADEKVRSAAFAEEILQGNNSTPIEKSNEHLIVIRLLEHKVATQRDLNEVKSDIIAILAQEKAQKLAVEKAQKIKVSLESGKSINDVAAEYKLDVKSENALVRGKSKLPAQLTEAVFKAAKPVGDKASVFIVGLPSGEQVVARLSKVTPGVMSDDDKKQMDLAKKNIANAFGQTDFNQVLNSLQAEADVKVHKKAQAQQQ